MYAYSFFKNLNFDWETIYVLLGIVTKDSRHRVF